MVYQQREKPGRHIFIVRGGEITKIDGKKVRLRNVHDLFMDTEVGTGFFLDYLQVDVEIFNSKPEVTARKTNRSLAA